MKLIKLRRYTGIFIGCMAISACQSDDESSQAPLDMYVPFSVTALPMPNDGYGYDDDFTISLPGEGDITGVDRENFYRSSDTVYAALDGWGLCTEPMQIPIASLNSNERYPLNPNTLADNVVLIKEDGTPVETNISSTSENIQIECTATLTEDSTYFLLVNDHVETSDGTQLQADPAFTELQNPDIVPATLTEQEQLVQAQIQAAKAAAGTSISGEIVYAAQFTTQSTYAILDSIIENNQSATLGDLTPVDTEGRNYDTYTATLTLPYYLPFQGGTPEPLNNKEACLIDEFDPIGACPDLYRWMRPKDNKSEHLTKENSLPASTELTINVDIYAPKDWGYRKLPVVQFIHGVTANKGTASLMAKDYTDQDNLVVAIDMPYHGERILLDDEGNEIGAEINKADFINISSPLTLRGNLNQAVSDNLSLRNALINAPWANETNTHLIGHSLGGIVAVMVSEMSQTPSAALRTNDLSYKTVNFVVPGQGLVNLVLTSDLLGPETEESVKKSPDIQRGIAETVIPDLCDSTNSNEECIVALRTFSEGSIDNANMIAELEDEIYSLILPSFKHGVQTSVDSADPANFTSRQVANKQPTLLIEAVGTCGETCEVGEYMPDYVVPNSSPDNILTGTDPLITALQLDDIRDSTQGGSGEQGTIRGVIRATVGGHGTYLFAYEGPMDETGAPGTSDLGKVRTATETQQISVSSMIFSDGDEIEIDDHTNIESEITQ
ncbi:hypothetical protein [Moritella marina]|uniref:hypothetical protein n=1 Tax=Moritella marina TaxID=90736 RepID=UPI003704000B